MQSNRAVQATIYTNEVMMSRPILLVLLLVLTAGSLWSQQVADTVNIPAVATPNYKFGEGPLVAIDAAHNNFHTVDERYLPFATVLRRDGYRVIGTEQPFTDSLLATIDILVISNPVHESNLGRWSLPTPSAFTDPEIEAVIKWINEGGRLFLIADHMPFPGAVMALGKALGVTWSNGYAVSPEAGGFTQYRKNDSTVLSHETTKDIDSIISFTGSAFQVDERYTPLLVFPPTYNSYLTEVAGEINDSTAFESVVGWPQLAVAEIGKGRVVLSGEAAMFTAQIAGEQQMRFGMNHPEALHNSAFLLNLLHWLGAGF